MEQWTNKQSAEAAEHYQCHLWGAEELDEDGNARCPRVAQFRNARGLVCGYHYEAQK